MAEYYIATKMCVCNENRAVNVCINYCLLPGIYMSELVGDANLSNFHKFSDGMIMALSYIGFYEKNIVCRHSHCVWRHFS